MATKTFFINSSEATYNDSEFAWFQTLMLTEGIIGDDTGAIGFLVEENTAPDMSVLVGIGKALVEVTISGRTFKVVVENDTQEQVVIPANSSGATRVDTAIVRVDKDATPNVLKTNVSTIEVITGTSDTALTDSAIDTEVGDDGWYRLADVAVANGASSVVNAEITDHRKRIETLPSFDFNGKLPTGTISPYAGRTAPTGHLVCNGSAVARSSYPDLFELLNPSENFTVTIADPAVFTKTSHGLIAGDRITLSTTGGLPSGLSSDTYYYVLSTGITADTFRVALSPNGTAVVTTGSQSGVHTYTITNYGKGDGSTTFNLPDLRTRVPVGRGASNPTTTLDFEPSARSVNDVSVPDKVFPLQGQKVRLTTTGTLPTGLSLATDYYVIRNSDTSISFATSQLNANRGTKIALSDGGSGVHTITYTNTAISNYGKLGGEHEHGQSRSELPSHAHTIRQWDTTNSGDGGDKLVQNTIGNRDINGDLETLIEDEDNRTDNDVHISNEGGNTQANNMQPYIVLNYIIKT